MIAISQAVDWALKNIPEEPEKAAQFNAWNRRMEAEARNMWKPECCALCGKKIDRPCDSHTVPHFVLQNLVDDRGKIYFSFKFLNEISFWNTEGRPKSAGIFKLLCNDCDNQVFKIYEDPKALLNGISSQAATAIALKNLLFVKCKREQEILAMELILNELRDPDANPKTLACFKKDYAAIGYLYYDCYNKQQIYRLDLKDLNEEIETAKKALQDGDDIYRCIYHRVLDYTIPVAYQGAMTIPSSFYGDVVNNTLDTSVKTKMEYLHTVVFPLKNQKSVVALLVDRRAENYRFFESDFNELSEDERLAMVNYLLFFFEEDYYLSPRLPERIFKSSAVKKLVGKTYNQRDFRKIEACRETQEMVPAYRRFKCVENLLAPEYRIS